MNEKLERIKDRLVHGTGETREETTREEIARHETGRPVDGAPAGPEPVDAPPGGVLPGDRLVAGRREDLARDGLADDDTAPTAVITDRPGDAPASRETADRPGLPDGEAVRHGRPDAAHDEAGAPSPVPAAHGVPDSADAAGASLPGHGTPSPAPQGAPSAPRIPSSERDAGRSPAPGSGHSPTGGGPLFEHDADEIRRRWQEVQVGFVDDPRDSVTRADALLEELVGSLRTALERRTSTLRQRWDGDERDTEDLRTALRDYRATLEQLLNLASGTR
ncbi:hypothetical protein AB0D67_24500 [Streptosporangium sp. NPDC048047]|uniref:hypothetical protein n=1 Tax=Streptosporangium sp. NPDC048047 TaxID=3155748 RepID=UPI0034474D91